jgi:hypothetical protein|tara:strand:- start:1136 stop:1819 length:684 start_codon:yes stop_codon:yes gene_type:complete
MRHRILQYNTDGFNHGNDYFAKVIVDVDYALLQRLPIKNQLFLIKDIHLERSISGMTDSLYVGIAKLSKTSAFKSGTSYDLPSAKTVKKTGDNFQGSKAICTGVNRIVLCSVLPCYPDNYPTGNILQKNTLEDVKYLLNKLKHTKCIIAGDFHHAPGDFKELDDLIKDYGFTSYLDDHDTFVHPDGSKFNLDRMISNIPDLTVDNIKVHQPDNPDRHQAITYEVNYS